MIKKCRVAHFDENSSCDRMSDLSVSRYRINKSELIYTCDKYEWYCQEGKYTQIYTIDKSWNKSSKGRVQHSARINLVARMCFSY